MLHILVPFDPDLGASIRHARLDVSVPARSDCGHADPRQVDRLGLLFGTGHWDRGDRGIASGN